MAQIQKNKLNAMIAKHGAPKAPAKKPNGGGGPPGGNPFAKKGGGDKPPGEHAQKEAEHEGGGENADHEQKEHDAGNDTKVAQQQADRVADGNGDDKIVELIGGEEHEQGGEPPPWVQDAALWERAEHAVSTIADIDDDERMSVIAHTYQALGGEIDHGDEDGEEGGDDKGGDGGDTEEEPDHHDDIDDN